MSSELKDLLAEGIDNAFQDWHAEHVLLRNDIRLIRIYVISRQPPVVHKMAESEYDILSNLHHPGILEAQGYAEHELGPPPSFAARPAKSASITSSGNGAPHCRCNRASTSSARSPGRLPFHFSARGLRASDLP